MDFRTGARRKFDNTEVGRVRQEFGHLLVLEGQGLQRTRRVHTVFHGCVHRGFTDPSIRANHGRFVGVLTPLTQGMLHWIGHWGVDQLMRGSIILTYLVTAVIDRARSIIWTDVTRESYTQVGV